MKAIALLKIFSIAALSLAVTAAGASSIKIEQKTNAAPTQVQAQAIKQITLDNAIDIAVSDAKISRSQANFTETKKDKDGSVLHYDIEFIANSKEYDYEIALSDGKILKRDAEEIVSSSQKTEPSKKGYIGVDAAKSAALKKVGLSSSQVKFKEAKLDSDGDTAHYDIEFTYGKNEYEFEINAVMGDVIKYEKENTSFTSQSSASTKSITLSQAKAVALKRASLLASQVKFKKAAAEYDDGILYYDIEFTSGNYEYDFEIRAKDGKITDFDKEKIEVKTTVAKHSDHITVQKAQSIALSHANLKTADVKELKAEFEKDNGLAFYEIEFEHGRFEYEYKINAESGKIISAEKEAD